MANSLDVEQRYTLYVDYCVRIAACEPLSIERWLADYDYIWVDWGRRQAKT